MIRTIKLLGLMALAGLAMSAVFASGAQAVPNPDGEFTAGATLGETETGEHTATEITGEQYGEGEDEDFFTTTEGTVTCTDTGVEFTGEDADGTAKEITVTPHYTECIANGTNPATVDMNECDYRFTQPEAVAGTNHDTWRGTVDLVCPGENEVEVTAFAFGGTGHDGHATLACTISLPEQHNLGDVTYHNNDTGDFDDLTVTVNITELAYEENGFGCPESGQSKTDGEYESTVTVQADNTKTKAADDHDLWISTAAGE